MEYGANDIKTLDFRTAIRSRIPYHGTKILELLSNNFTYI